MMLSQTLKKVPLSSIKYAPERLLEEMQYFNTQKIQLSKYTLGFEKSIKSHHVSWPSSFLEIVCDLMILILLQSAQIFPFYWNVTSLTWENYSNSIQFLFFCHRFQTTKNRIAHKILASPSTEVFLVKAMKQEIDAFLDCANVVIKDKYFK